MTRFGELTTREVAEAVDLGALLLLPVGAVEQHGPHLPLSTDVVIPRELALRVAPRCGGLVMPEIAWGVHSQPRSGGGRYLAGSVGVAAATLTDVVASVVEECLRQGFERLAVLNGHFENSQPIFAALDALLGPGAPHHHRSDHGPRAALINWWELLDDGDLRGIFGAEFPGWEAEHAGVVETSLMEELAPDLVRGELKAAGGAARPVRYDVFPAPESTLWANGIGSTALPAGRRLGASVCELLVDRIAAALATDLAAGAGKAENAAGTSADSASGGAD